MNCEDFNNIINELADYKPLAVSTRDAGVSHAALCAGCAAKLANARAVSATLLLAAGAESEAAPARIKADLLTAFAAQQSPAATDRVVPVVAIASRRRLGWWAAAAAVAAAAVVVFAVMQTIWKVAPLPDPNSRVAVKAPPVETPTATPVAPPPTDEPAPQPAKATVKRSVLRQRSPRVIGATTNETVAGNTANEFVPLTYLATATAIDTGTIVRVQLSRSALVRLGLPINIESSNETVKAEVVMGDDGVARAIRLID